jgi:hypothetical protein
MLEPSPPVIAKELEFKHLGDDGEYFEVDAGKKYFVQFPKTLENEFYLVLKIESDPDLEHIFTYDFNDDEKSFDQVKNESERIGEYAYDIPTSKNFYFFVITNVKKDVPLRMQYRYVPKWRYKFEVGHNNLQKELEENTSQRKVFDSFGIDFDSKNFAYASELGKLEKSLTLLKNNLKKLEKISSVLPKNINPNDKAFIAYNELTKLYTEEITFQEKYYFALKNYSDLRPGASSDEFLTNLKSHVELFSTRQENYTSETIVESKKLTNQKLNQLVKEFNNNLRNRASAEKITWDTEGLMELASLTGGPANKFMKLNELKYTNNYIIDELESIKSDISTISNQVNENILWPSNQYYSSKLNKLSIPERKLRKVDYSALNAYKNYGFVKKLDSELARLNSTLRRLKSELISYQAVVKEVNSFKETDDYKSIIRLIQRKRNLSRLRAHCADVDKKSLNFQTQTVRNFMVEGNWGSAENDIHSLFEDKTFLNLNSVFVEKNERVGQLETELMNEISQASKERAKKFSEENKLVHQNISALYKNPAFLPVHSANFVSVKRSLLAKQFKNLKNSLNKIKTIEFPENSVNSLFQMLSKNKNQTAVFQARAILEHGKFYKGKNRKVWFKISEANTKEAKRITKPAQWRNLFVMPINSSKKDMNTYVFRLNVQIPSNSKFPVYDVNVKLAKEIGEEASFRKWYKSIKMKGDEIKNEGRYTISSPDPKDNYKMQVTPVQAIRGENNIFEITFTHSDFKVFEISVMLQRPLIKK